MACEPDETVEIMNDGGVIYCPASMEQHMADRSALAALRPQRRAELDEVRTLLLLFFCLPPFFCLLIYSFVCFFSLSPRGAALGRR
jgi:hypothetical protein